MSISVDDLVASLGANHIGQEAIDLVALQKQLSQALPHHDGPTALDLQKMHHSDYAQHHNTPTNLTPSTSFRFDSTRLGRSRSCSMASMNTMPEPINETPQERGHEDDFGMDEDERMVDEMLLPSPVSARPVPLDNPSFYPRSFQVDHPSQKIYSPQSAEPGAQSPGSTFTTTDPFYLAELQASQAPPSASPFTFLGRPSQQSPFIATSQKARRSSVGRVTNFPVLAESNQAFAFSAAAR